MSQDSLECERIYHEGWLARRSGQPIDANPYPKDDGVKWELGWYRADAGLDYDGYDEASAA